MNSELIAPVALALVLFNLVAALMLLFSRGFTSQDAAGLVASKSTPTTAAAGTEPRPEISGFRVREAYEATGRLRGEARLAADMEGRNTRRESGEFLPVAADACRSETGRARRNEARRSARRGLKPLSDLARGLKREDQEVSHV